MVAETCSEPPAVGVVVAGLTVVVVLRAVTLMVTCPEVTAL